MCKGPGTGTCFTCWRDRKKANVAEAEKSRDKVRSALLGALEGLQALARLLDFIPSTEGSH